MRRQDAICITNLCEYLMMYFGLHKPGLAQASVRLLFLVFFALISHGDTSCGSMSLFLSTKMSQMYFSKMFT